MNVLSLFDGMSCGQLALQRAGFDVDIYMASEIDKYGMQVTRKNFPNTIQMGDVCALRGENLPPIDLLMGGSPCQGFSFAGKQLNFKDPRSALFFQFVRLLRETKPKYFLLENVRMKQEYQDVISEHLGVKPIMINSALVSAQNRVRLYWTNIPGIEQPEDKGIVLKDILEDLPIDKPLAPYMTGEFDGVSRLDKGIFTFTDKDKSAAQTGSGGHANKYLIQRPCTLREAVNSDSECCQHVATADDINGHDCIKRVYADSGKSPTLNACTGGNREPKVLVKGAAKRNQVTKRGIEAQLNIRKDDKSNCVVASWSHKLNGCVEYTNDTPTYRKLTPMECMRLQTVPDHYFDDTGISNTQKYKLLGNGWTVDIICHVLKNIRAEFARKVA